MCSSGVVKQNKLYFTLLTSKQKRKRPITKDVVIGPILSKDFAFKGQVNLTDMQSIPHMNYKLIMVYQDHLTKLCVLRPFVSKRTSEVAYQVMDVFLLFGAHTVLQFDNSSEL